MRDAKNSALSQHAARSILFNTFFSIPARRVPLRGTQNRKFIGALALLRLLAATLLLLTGSVALANDDAVQKEVIAATAAWAEAFNARDAQRIAALYAHDAVFWGTISPTIRTTPEAVLEYFTNSTTKRPNLRIAIGEQHARVYGDTAINSGYYTSRNVQDGQEIITPMRFTFVFHQRGGRWMIVSHHSSRMPAP
jgi:uncharacterized protein (TIGR02246 family)